MTAAALPSFTPNMVQSDLSHVPPKLPTTSSTTRKRQLEELGLYALRRELVRLVSLSQAQAMASSTSPMSGGGGAWVEKLDDVTVRLEALAGDHHQHHDQGSSKTASEAAAALWGPGKSARLLRWSKVGYLAALHKKPEGLPLSVRLVGMEWAAGEGGKTKKKDESEHQNMRDVERDVLRLNGVVYRAGLGGYAKVVRWLVDVMRQALQAVSTPENQVVPSSTLLDAFARALLRSVNRTNSGGAAYDTLTEVLALEGVTNVVPDSKRAGPLTLQVDVGAFRLPPSVEDEEVKDGQDDHHHHHPPPRHHTGGSWSWGLRARLSALTVYDVYDEAVEDQWAKVGAEYRRRVYLPLVNNQRESKKGEAGPWVQTRAEVYLSEWED